MANARKSSNNRARSSNKSKGRKLRGRGDYTDEVTNDPNFASRMEKKIDHIERFVYNAAPKKHSVNAAASMAGRAIGTAFGQGDLGAFAGDRLARLFGHGDYRVAVKGNSLMAGLSGPTVPKFSSDGRRGVRLTEREFLGNIVAGTVVSGSTTFSNQTFDLNPTSPGTFPWLSKIATLFDQWDPHGIVFEFVTTSSTFNGTSQALGAVIMATDYDANAAVYGTKQEMENADYACSSVPSSNLVHGVECDPQERPLPVMYTTVRAGLKNFSSLGNFQIATQGCSTTGVVLGELWVSYDITFFKKQLISSTTDLQFICAAGNASIGDPIFPVSGIISQAFFTVNAIIGTGVDIIMPASQGTGRYLIDIVCPNAGAGDSPDTNVTLTNAVQQSSVTSTFTGGSSFTRNIIFNVTAPGAKVRFGLRSTIGVGAYKISIVEVPSTYVFGP